MLKLKKSVREFLKANVKPDCLKRSIKNIEEIASLNGCANYFRIDEPQSIHGVRIDFDLSKDCFEEVENLKPYKWYPREMWDENPQGYLVVQALDKKSKEHGFSPYDFGAHPVSLWSNATHFMYIEPLEVEDDE